MSQSTDPAKDGVEVDIKIDDYHLTRLLYKGTLTKTYIARQLSVGRDVIFVRMIPDYVGDQIAVNGFIADVRAKAKLTHPTLGKVYEAVNQGGECYFTKELLPKKTLEDLIDGFQETDTVNLLAEKEARLSPLEIARILRAIAEVMVYCQDKNAAIVSIAPHQIHLGKTIRIGTIGISGEMEEAAYEQSKLYTSQLLMDCLSNEGKGRTRVDQLLTYMAKRNTAHPLSWMDVLRKVNAIVESTRDGEDDLIAPTERLKFDLRTYRVPFQVWRNIIRVSTALASVTLIAFIGFIFRTEASSEKRAKTNKEIIVPAGEYENHKGEKVTIEAFNIDSHEVTIAEYKEFLDDLEALTPDKRKVFDHPDQPANKISHAPRNWFSMVSSIGKKNEEGVLTLDHDFPVVGIDWWDAYAYAQWKGRRLPKAEEWLAAASKIINTKQIYDRWTSIGKNAQDQGYQGLVDMAGGVREWLGEKVVNPAFPYDAPRPAVAGASFDIPLDGIYAMHWVESRDEVAKDIGFRTVLSE